MGEKGREKGGMGRGGEEGAPGVQPQYFSRCRQGLFSLCWPASHVSEAVALGAVLYIQIAVFHKKIKQILTVKLVGFTSSVIHIIYVGLFLLTFN